MRTPLFFTCASVSTICIDPEADAKWGSNEAGELGVAGVLMTTAPLLLGADTSIWPGISGWGVVIGTG